MAELSTALAELAPGRAPSGWACCRPGPSCGRGRASSRRRWPIGRRRSRRAATACSRRCARACSAGGTTPRSGATPRRERRAVLRLFELMARFDDEGAARAVLADWCYRHPEDAESLRLLAARDQAAERWDAVVESAFRLIEVETGPAQIAAAELLVGACERLGQAAPAIAGLESALRQQPENRWLFDTLMGALRGGGGEAQAGGAAAVGGRTQPRSPDASIRPCARRGRSSCASAIWTTPRPPSSGPSACARPTASCRCWWPRC